MSLALMVGSSIASGLFGARSANRAAQAQVEAAEVSADLQRELYYDGVERQEPWYDSGTNALRALNFELGLGPRPGIAPEIVEFTRAPAGPTRYNFDWRHFGDDDNQLYVNGERTRILARDRASQLRQERAYERANPLEPASGTQAFSVGGKEFSDRGEAEAYANSLATDYRGFQETPGFQYMLDQSQDAINKNAAARGQRFSGATLNALSDNAMGLANQEYGNYLNRLSGMANVGGATASNIASSGNAMARNVGATTMAAGQARASGYQGVNNAFQGTMNNLGAIYGMSQAGFFGDNSAGLWQNVFGAS